MDKAPANHKGMMWMMIVILVLLVIVIGLMTYWMFFYEADTDVIESETTEEAAITTTTTPATTTTTTDTTTAVADPYAGWETYDGTAMKASIKYPADATLTVSENEKCVMVKLAEGPHLSFGLSWDSLTSTEQGAGVMAACGRTGVGSSDITTTDSQVNIDGHGYTLKSNIGSTDGQRDNGWFNVLDVNPSNGYEYKIEGGYAIPFGSSLVAGNKVYDDNKDTLIKIAESIQFN